MQHGVHVASALSEVKQKNKKETGANFNTL
jgi:hypothetical protein